MLAAAAALAGCGPPSPLSGTDRFERSVERTLNGTSGRVSPLWLVAVYFVQTVGELTLSPVGLSATTKLAPAAAVGTTMGVWFLSTSAGDVIGGYLGGLYEQLSLPVYFGALGALTIVAGVAMVLASRHVVRLMAGLR